MADSVMTESQVTRRCFALTTGNPPLINVLHRSHHRMHVVGRCFADSDAAVSLADSTLRTVHELLEAGLIGRLFRGRN